MADINIKLKPVRQEKYEEKDLVKLCRKLGGVALKLKIDGQRGFPDRTLLFPQGIVLFIELKTYRKGSATSKQQEKWLKILRSLNFVAEVCRTVDEVESLIPWA